MLSTTFASALALVALASELAAQRPVCVLANTRAMLPVTEPLLREAPVIDSVTPPGCSMDGEYLPNVVYRLTVPTTRAIRITLNGGAAALRLYSRDGELIDADAVGVDTLGDETGATIREALAAGTYYVTVATLPRMSFELRAVWTLAESANRATCTRSDSTTAFTLGQIQRGVLPGSGGCVYRKGPAALYKMVLDSPREAALSLAVPENNRAAVWLTNLGQHWARQLHASKSCADANKALQYLGVVDANLPGAAAKFAVQAKQIADASATLRTYVEGLKAGCV